jgi:hypothetical protein
LSKYQAEEESSHSHKKSVAKAIYKKNKQDANNYNPTALDLALPKIQEKLIANQLTSHNIFNKSQLGFWKNKSMKNATTTSVKNIIENLNNKM